MKFFFSHAFQIASSLNRRDALAAIQAHTEPAKVFARVGWPSKRNDLRFEGVVTDSGFQVRRIMGYRNGFAPRVEGVVHPATHGSLIDITMKLHTSLVVLLVVSLVLLLAVLIFARSELLLILVIPPYYGLGLYFFWFEARKQEHSLRKIFQGPGSASLP